MTSRSNQIEKITLKPKNRIQANGVSKLILWFVILLCIVISMFGELIFSKADPQVYNLVQHKRISLRNKVGNFSPDFGVEVSFSVLNRGKTGKILVLVVLSCSDGKWNKRQELLLQEGEEKELRFWFPEPTVNSMNFQDHVIVVP